MGASDVEYPDALAAYVFPYLASGHYLTLGEPHTDAPSDTKVCLLLPYAPQELRKLLLDWQSAYVPVSGRRAQWVFLRKSLNTKPPIHEELVRLVCESLSKTETEVQAVLACTFED